MLLYKSKILRLLLFIGNRTPKQVSSRVQKYFIKLLRAGLPIPGRGPKLSSKMEFKKSFTHKQRTNHSLFKRSTFFPHQDISFNSDENKEQPVADESVSIVYYYLRFYFFYLFIIFISLFIILAA